MKKAKLVTKLFSPLKIRDLEIKNRIWLSPMCMYSCENQDGVPNTWHLVHLGARASGGAGLVMAEATAVSPEGRITPWDTGLWSDEQVAAWLPITEFIRSQGAASAIQLAHAGRKASTYREWSGSGSVPMTSGGWQTVSAHSEPFAHLAAPRELSESELAEVVSQFVAAAVRARSAGFDAIEIHAAHGYLLHQFLSPISNQRSDSYGGSLENRARLLLDIVSGVRSALGSGSPMFVRFSATDYIEGGWTVEDTVQVSRWCAELGADLFDLSSGGIAPGVAIPTGPGYQVDFAKRVRAETGALTNAVGQITDPWQAEEILQSGAADTVMLGREMLRDPFWPMRAAHELGVEATWPKQYTRGAWPAS
jgi:2,4-dienoyl-CoA reductase-like NADH-dependent reductase (Old Yellow Enzyme family)